MPLTTLPPGLTSPGRRGTVSARSKGKIYIEVHPSQPRQGRNRKAAPGAIRGTSRGKRLNSKKGDKKSAVRFTAEALISCHPYRGLGAAHPHSQIAAVEREDLPGRPDGTEGLPRGEEDEPVTGTHECNRSYALKS